MLREFVLVGLLVTLLAAAWLWLADGGELAGVDWFAPRHGASEDSASRDDGSDAITASRRASIGEGYVASDTDAQLEALFTVPIVPDEPIIVPHEFVVLGPYHVPVAGAVAAFTVAPEWNLPPGVFATAVSDAEGRISVGLVAGALHSVHVEATGYANHESELTANLGPRSWVNRIELEPIATVAIEGDVVAPGGRPLPAHVLDLLRSVGESGGAPLDLRDSPQVARVWVVFVPSGVGTPTRLDSSYDVRPHAGLDERGAFRFDAQPLGVAGELQLHWCDRVFARTAWSGRGNGARLVLDPEQFLASLCSLEIAVTGFAGAIDEDWLTLLVNPAVGRFYFDRRIARGDDRSLVFARLPAGTYLVALKATETLARRRIELAPGEAARVELDAAVVGTIVAILHGIDGALPESLMQPPTLVDGSGFHGGTFEPVRGAAVGSYRAVVPPGRYVVSYGDELKSVELAAGGATTVEFAWRDFVFAQILVRVPDPAKYVLHDEITLAVTLETSAGTCLSCSGVRTAVGRDGTAEWNILVAAGEYRVVVGLDGKETSAPLRVRLGEPEPSVTLVFDP